MNAVSFSGWIGKVVKCESKLPQIVLALRTAGGFSRGLHGRQYETDQMPMIAMTTSSSIRLKADCRERRFFIEPSINPAAVKSCVCRFTSAKERCCAFHRI